MSTRLTAVVVTSLVAACSADRVEPRPETAPPPGSSPEGEGAPTPSDPIQWLNCSLVPNANDYGAQCAEVVVPRDHANPSGPTIPIALKRIPATKGPRRGSVWLLHGGPGASGVVGLATLAGELPNLVPDLDYITLDHRGVGGSARLGCPKEEAVGSLGDERIEDAEWPGCILAIETKWGPALSAFSTTAAAQDVGHLIERTRRPSDRVFVWGGSYGSYVAQRYMHLFPNQANGVVLEAITGPDVDFARHSADMNEVGKQLFAKCAADTTCAEKLGPDPWTTARGVVASLDQGHCSELKATSARMRTFLGALLYYEVVRGAIPPIVYRTKRCSTADVTAIRQIFDFFADGLTVRRPALGVLDDSTALFFQIAVSEFWRPPGITVPAAETELASMVTATPLTVDVARIAPGWPKSVKPDAYHGRLPEYVRPLLMLQGGLDPATPAKYTEALRVKYTGPLQTFAFFPTGAHDPTNGTMSTKTATSCALDLYAQFLRDPMLPLDTSCMKDVEDVSFLSNKDVSLGLLGTADAWD